MPLYRSTYRLSAALVASMAVHGVAAGAMAWITLSRPEPQLLDIRNSPFAGQQVAIALSFARPEVKIPPPPERPPVESPLLVTPDVARHQQEVFVDKTAAEVVAATTTVAPRVEVSELKALDAPVAEREHTERAKADATSSAVAKLARTPRERMPSTPAAAVVPQTLGTTDRRPARMNNNRPPRYPDIARQNRWEGTVLLKLSIDERGRVTAAEVARSSGHSILDAAAVTAVRQWQGDPATRDGVAVESEEYLPVRFRLQ